MTTIGSESDLNIRSWTSIRTSSVIRLQHPDPHRTTDERNEKAGKLEVFSFLLSVPPHFIHTLHPAHRYSRSTTHQTASVIPADLFVMTAKTEPSNRTWKCLRRSLGASSRLHFYIWIKAKGLKHSLVVNVPKANHSPSVGKCREGLLMKHISHYFSWLITYCAVFSGMFFFGKRAYVVLLNDKTAVLITSRRDSRLEG